MAAWLLRDRTAERSEYVRRKTHTSARQSVRLIADGVTVSNMFIIDLVPWGMFREFRINNGLTVVMTDGREVGSFAFGGSLAADLTGFRGMRRIVEQLDADGQKLAAGPAPPGQPAGGRPASGRRHACRSRVHFDVWPLVALLMPLELIGLVTAMFP